MSLSLMDLCSLAESCIRFKRISPREFYNDFSLKGCSVSGYYFRSARYGIGVKNVQEVDRILKSFASYLSVLVISYDQVIVNTIARYCKDISLQRLTIDGMRSVNGLKVKLKPIFQQLPVLVFRSCDLIRDATSLDLSCDSLTELKIVNTTGCVAILRNFFPKLEQFTFKDSEVYDSSDNLDVLSAFISRHKRLKSLKLINMEWSGDFNLLHTINKSCKKLETLTLDFSWRSDVPFKFSNLLSNLVNLKTLSVECSSEYSAKLLRAINSVSLRTLEIRNSWNVSFRYFDVISKMENLCELRLPGCRFNHNFDITWTKLNQLKKLFVDRIYLNLGVTYQILNIIKELPNLEELQLQCAIFRLKETEFAEIVKIANERTNVLRLECNFDFDCSKYCDNNRKIKLTKCVHNK